MLYINRILVHLWVPHRSPVILDLILQELEKNIIDSLDIRLKFYYRYVDDIIISAPIDKIKYILDYFNRYHERLQFTVENLDNGKINFLDLNIILENSKVTLVSQEHILWKILIIFFHTIQNVIK